MAGSGKAHLHDGGDTILRVEDLLVEFKTEEHGKKVVYYIEDNDISKAFHKKVCSSIAQVTAKGTVSEKDGKKWIKVSKLEETK